MVKKTEDDKANMGVVVNDTCPRAYCNEGIIFDHMGVFMIVNIWLVFVIKI